MSMPDRVVFVRHGLSEANVVNNAAKKGDESLRTEEFKSRHDSQMRLTPEGGQQAIITGEWLQEEFGPDGFDRYYVSPHIRTRETAANLRLGPALGWMLNDLLRERDWGEYSNLSAEEREDHFPLTGDHKELNPWYWAPPGGESLATGVRLRLERFLNTMHRELEKQKVINVVHGETMWVARFILEKIDVLDWLDLDDDKSQRIPNGMVLDYSRTDPESPRLRADKLMWVRGICPWDESRSLNGGDWWEIERKTFSDEELLAQVNAIPRLLDYDS